MTYEGAHSIIGPYLKDLGATATEVGLVAGFGEMMAASLRYFSGKYADRTRAYWTISICGYLLNVIVVPALAFVGSWKAAALLVIAERTGKALRGPARDVLLSEATAEVGHGWGFGLHSIMDQTGAVIGPLLMAGAVAHYNHVGPAFLLLGIPAVLAVASLVTARVIHPTRGKPPKSKGPEPFPDIFWPYVFAAGVLACGFMDFPLLGFHLEKTGITAPAVIPLLFSGAMAVNGITALIFGRLFDRYGLIVLTFGILVSLFALPLGFLGGTTAVIIGVACWATGLGVQDACLRSGIAQVVSMNERGGAFGAFNGVYGVMWFIGSAAMGLLYDHSIMALVIFGVVAQLIAAVMFFRLRGPLAVAARAAAA